MVAENVGECTVKVAEQISWGVHTAKVAEKNSWGAPRRWLKMLLGDPGLCTAKVAEDVAKWL